MNTPLPQSAGLPPDALRRLEGATQRTLGLMHLLAVAYNAKDDSNGPPTRDEADGIIWLATKTGEELTSAIQEAFQGLDTPPNGGAQ